MLETATDPTFRALAAEVHRQRSLVAWQMIGAARRLQARLLAWHAKGAAPKNGPANAVACAA
jgi:hypothetical protein